MKAKGTSKEKQVIGLSQVIESQKQTFDALMKKYNKLNSTFEEVLKKEFVLSELRDFWRERAGTIK